MKYWKFDPLVADYVTIVCQIETEHGTAHWKLTLYDKQVECVLSQAKAIWESIDGLRWMTITSKPYWVDTWGGSTVGFDYMNWENPNA